MGPIDFGGLLWFGVALGVLGAGVATGIVALVGWLGALFVAVFLVGFVIGMSYSR